MAIDSTICDNRFIVVGDFVVFMDSDARFHEAIDYRIMADAMVS